MNRQYSTVVLTLICLLGLGLSARAQDEGRVVVNVPFDFVAGGATFPAATYSVSRLSSETSPTLVIRGQENSAFLLPIVFDDAASGTAELSFEHVGDKYFLSKVRTLAGVYTIGTPRAATKLGQMKEHAGTSSSGN